MLQNNEFIEAGFIHVQYGTSVAELKLAHDQGVPITDIDVQGVEEYERLTGMCAFPVCRQIVKPLSD